MHEPTSEPDSDQRSPAAEILPAVYTELRRLAQHRLAQLPPGQTLQPTALVHEAYMRLVGTDDPGWDSKGHFFGAAAQAMRNILVDEARRKSRTKRGGGRLRVSFEDGAFEPEAAVDNDQLLILDEALKRLEATDPRKAELVNLRYFAGLSMGQIADVLGTPLRTLEREWKFVRVWLHREMSES